MEKKPSEQDPTSLTPLSRWAGKLLAAGERLVIGPNGRYERHVGQLRGQLKKIPTHHSTHDLLSRFISDLPRAFARPHPEDGQVHLINKISLEPWRDDASIELVLEAMTGYKKGAKELLDEAYAARRSSEPADEIYLQVAQRRQACARGTTSVDKTADTHHIQEYVLPTAIRGVVMGFSGLGISRISDIQGSPLEIKFYSVPDPEQ